MNIGLFAQTICTSKGGIERATSRLSSWLCEHGHRCIIYHWGKEHDKPQFQLHPAVRTCSLPVTSQIAFQRSRERLINDNLDVFCCAIATKHRTIFLQLLNQTGIPLLMSERSSAMAIEEFFMPRRDRLASFAGADGIHLLSEKYLDTLPAFLRERATVIPNAAPPVVPIDWRKRRTPKKILLAVGSLYETEKRFSLLIRAFATLAKRFPDWDCHICGEGYGREEYKRLIEDCNLQERILLRGAVDDIESEYSASSIFCMPSAFEGCPNALLEAQSFGLPSVGFSDCTGVNDIIIDGENGFLVRKRNPNSLADALAVLMEDEVLRERFSVSAQRLSARYDSDVLFARWEEMLTHVAASKGATRLNYVVLPPDSEDDSILCLRNLLSQGSEFSSKQNWLKNINLLRKNKTLGGNAQK